MNYLYDQYIESLVDQKILLKKLLVRSCTIAGVFGIVLFLLFFRALFSRKKIKWNWIWIENMLMLLLLGIFEYIFFTTIIMRYKPITDAEIKYHVVSEFVNYMNDTIYN